ncbi:hypothetical protein HAX54_031789, partial [Datura stramonium]|nr:hypothetical protein [Datura stramonium]
MDSNPVLGFQDVDISNGSTVNAPILVDTSQIPPPVDTLLKIVTKVDQTTYRNWDGLFERIKFTAK